MEELRSRWEVPTVAHYISSLHEVFHLPDMHVEELETALLTSCTADGSDMLHQLLAALLSGFYNSKNIEYFNYESSLRDFLHQKWKIEEGRENPIESTEFRLLEMNQKIDILYSLCMYRLDADDVAEVTKGLNGEDLRIEPVGEDSEGFTYWNFNDERLYKEKQVLHMPERRKHKKKHKDKKRKKGKHRDSELEDPVEISEGILELSDWSLVCTNEEDWHTLIKQLKSSSQKQDKKLRKILANDFLPLIPEIISEKDKAMKKRMLEMLPKRESYRLARKREENAAQQAITAKLDAEDKAEERLRSRQLNDIKRKEELARQREERQRARELERQAKEQARQEREMRLVMREHKRATGNYDVADSQDDSYTSDEESDWDEFGHSTITPRQSSMRNKRSKTLNNSHSAFGPREYEKLNRILYQLQRDKNCWPFLEPVTKEIAPDYFDIISRPMDISAIRNKSTKKLYSSKDQFIEDFNLIVDNCIKYNGPSNEYSQMAVKLKEKFDSLVERSFQLNDAKRHQTVRHDTDDNTQSSHPSIVSNQHTDNSDNDYEDDSTQTSESEEAAVSGGSDDSYGKSLPRIGSSSRKPNNKRPNNSSRRKANAKTAKRQKKKSSSSDDAESSNQYSSDDDNSNNNEASRLDSSHLSADSAAGSPSPGRVFGIARRVSTTSSAHQILSNVDISNSSVTASVPQPVEFINGLFNSEKATPHSQSNHSLTGNSHSSLVNHSVASSKSSENGRQSHNDVARWMGKSPSMKSPTGCSSTVSMPPGINNGNHSNNLKVQEITTARTQQPFQGLFAQLHRTTSNDSS